ncbi:4995_t:CDS:2 [Gigaspora rosea]|nr:4995_t:CDS:2 [Gigaspora rosea]
MQKKYFPTKETVPLTVPLSRGVQSLKNFRRGSSTHSRISKNNGYLRMDSQIKQTVSVDHILQNENEEETLNEQYLVQDELLNSEEFSAHYNESNVEIVDSHNSVRPTTPKEISPVKLNRNNYKNGLYGLPAGESTPPQQSSQSSHPQISDIRGTTPVDTPPQAMLDTTNSNESGNRPGVTVSGTRVFVGDLSWKLSDKELRAEFKHFGTVNEALVIRDKNTGRSKGYGFVSFEEPHAALDAIKSMNGRPIDGRPIRVEAAEERPADDRYEGKKDHIQDYRRLNDYRRDMDHGRKNYYELRNRKERDVDYRSDPHYYRRDINRRFEKRDIEDRRENETRREFEYRRDIIRRRDNEVEKRDRDIERRREEFDNKRDRGNPLIEPHESYHSSSKIQPDVYSEKEKDRSKNSRKRARSNSIQQSDSYYSQSEALHTDTSPHPSLPPVMASSPNRSALSEHIPSARHEPRSPLFYSDIPQSSSRMTRKNYYNDGHSPEFTKKWDRERDRGIDRERDKELRDQPRYFEMDREMHRTRTSSYEYGREIDRARPPFYNREQDLRDRDFVRFREADMDPYINCHSPPGHSTYKDNYKRFNDYYYHHPPTYSSARRSLSPRPRYSARRSLSPGVRQPITNYERRYERDRPPRFDAARGHELDSRRDVDYNYRYNEVHNPGYNHSPMIHNSQAHVRPYDDNVVGTSANALTNETFQRDRPKSRHWGINNEKERDTKKIHSTSNDMYSDNYDRYRRERRKPWDVAADKKEKTRDVKSERDNGGTVAKDAHERPIPRERSTKYWDMNEDKSRELERSSNKSRDRDNRGNQERGEFEQAFSLNDDHPSTPALDFFPPITMPTDSFALQSSPSIGNNGHAKNNHTHF